MWHKQIITHSLHYSNKKEEFVNPHQKNRVLTVLYTFFSFFVAHALTDPRDIQYNVLFVYIQNVCVAPLCDQKGNTSKAILRTNTSQTEECTLFIHLSHAGNLQKSSGQLSKQTHSNQYLRNFCTFVSQDLRFIIGFQDS